MPHPAEDLCCELSQGISASVNCDKRIGGITDVRIACVKYIDSLTVEAENAATDPGAISAITIVDPAGGAVTAPFYSVAVRNKFAGFSFDYTFDEDTGSVVFNESVDFEITAFDDTTFVSIREMIGQEVAVIFKLRGETGDQNYYLAGGLGGLRINQIQGGTGTDAAVQTSFTISGESNDTFRRIDDDTNVQTLVDGLTA